MGALNRYSFRALYIFRILKFEIMIRINCFMRTAPKKREEVLAAAIRLTKATIEQQGCIAYDIFESATRDDVLMICESWASDADLQAHMDSEVFKKEVEIIKGNSEVKVEKF